MIFPTYFAPEAIELPPPAPMEMSIESLDSLDKALKDCPSCKPMFVMKDGSVKEMDIKTFERVMKQLRKLYAQTGSRPY